MNSKLQNGHQHSTDITAAVPALHGERTTSCGNRNKADWRASLAALCLAFAGFSAAPTAHAHPDASAASAISALPVASLLVGGSAVAGSVAAVPVALSTSGAVLIVKTVESTVRGTVLVLERVSDGARVSLEVAGKGLSIAVGTTVTVSVIAAGTVLSAANEVIAFIPNKLGQALMHNQQVTN